MTMFRTVASPLTLFSGNAKVVHFTFPLPNGQPRSLIGQTFIWVARRRLLTTALIEPVALTLSSDGLYASAPISADVVAEIADLGAGYLLDWDVIETTNGASTTRWTGQLRLLPSAVTPGETDAAPSWVDLPYAEIISQGETLLISERGAMGPGLEQRLKDLGDIAEADPEMARDKIREWGGEGAEPFVGQARDARDSAWLAEASARAAEEQTSQDRLQTGQDVVAATSQRILAETAAQTALLGANVFANKAAGEAATANGQQFVAYGPDESYATRYRMVAGAGVVQDSYPNRAALNRALLARQYGDIITLLNVGGVGNAITSTIPVSHDDVVLAAGIGITWTQPANNAAGAITLSIGATVLTIKAHDGSDLIANGLVGGRTYMARIRADATARLLSPVLPADIPALTRTARGAGDIIPLATVTGTGDAMTAILPPSHADIALAAGVRLSLGQIANNTGAATLTIGDVTYALKSHAGEDIPANGLVGGRTYQWIVRGDGTLRLSSPVIPADVATLTRTGRTNGDAILLAAPSAVGSDITASLPASHADLTIGSGMVLRFTHPATNTGPATLTIGGTTWTLVTYSAQPFAAGQLVGGRSYEWWVRGDGTMRLTTPLLASEIAETANAKVMTASERTLLASISAALAAAAPYDEGYVLVFDPATATFVLRPADDIGGLMSLKYYDESTIIGTAATELLEADSDIRRITIQNLSTTESIAIAFTGSAPVINGGGITLAPGGVLSEDNMPAGAVNAIASAAGVPITVYVGTKGNAPNWSRRAAALIARSSIAATLPTAYTAAVRELYRRLDGAKVLKDALYFHVLTGYDAEFSAFDWSRKAGALSPVGSPVHTRYVGWALDGSTQHLMTGRKWTDQAKVTVANVAMMVWADATINSNAKYAISSGDTGILANTSSSGHIAKAVSTGADPITGSTPGGMLLVQRQEAARASFTKNGAAKKILERASNTPLTAYEHVIGSIQTGTGPTTAGHWAGTPKFAYAGPALNDAQQAEVYAACNAYLTTIGGL